MTKIKKSKNHKRNQKITKKSKSHKKSKKSEKNKKNHKFRKNKNITVKIFQKISKSLKFMVFTWTVDVLIGWWADLVGRWVVFVGRRALSLRRRRWVSGGTHPKRLRVDFYYQKIRKSQKNQKIMKKSKNHQKN